MPIAVTVAVPAWVGIALGGAVGALARYGMNLLLTSRQAHTSWASFPLATLIVNVLGSFLLALVVTLALRGHLSPAWRLALGTGFIGALTTFSTFEWEADFLLREGELLRAALYVFGNLFLGFLGIGLGRAAALAISAAIGGE